MVNSAAMNIPVQVVESLFSILCGIYSGVEWLGHVNILYLEELQDTFLSVLSSYTTRAPESSMDGYLQPLSTCQTDVLLLLSLPGQIASQKLQDTLLA